MSSSSDALQQATAKGPFRALAFRLTIPVLAVAGLTLGCGSGAPSEAPADTSEPPPQELVIATQAVIHSEILDEDRTLWISLPEGYDESEGRYPVMFFLDGEGTGRYMKAVASLDQLRWERAPQVILVGIENTDRNRDMFPVVIPDRAGTGGGDNFLRFLSEELIPFIDGRYRTEPFRILYGASNAGLFVVYALLAQPETFSAYLASSPMLGWCYDLIRERTAELFASGERPRKNLYIIYGEDPGELRAAREAIPPFIDRLEREAPGWLRWRAESVADEGHVPYASVHRGLSFLFEEWAFPSEELVSAGLEGVLGYYDGVSQRYGIEASPPIVVLLDLGNAMLREDRAPEALEAFRVAAGLYSHDPNSNYYLALALQRTGQNDRAVEACQRTLELDPGYAPARHLLEELTAGGS